MSDSPFGRYVPDVLRDNVAKFRIGSALDVGCANGAVTQWLAGLGFKVTGIDVDLPEVYRSCRKNGLEEREPNAFWSPRRGGSVSFFTPGELRRWAEALGLVIVSYIEEGVDDNHPPLGPHTHALVTAVFRQPI